MGKHNSGNENIPNNWNRLLYNRTLIHLLVIVAFTLILWEIFGLQIYDTNTGLKLRYLYISRGIFGGIVVAAYALWNIFIYKNAYEEKLARTEEYYKTIIDNSGFAIISLDADWDITFWNIGAASIFGWSEDEIRGKHISVLLPGNDSDVEPVLPDFLKNCRDNHYYDAIYRTRSHKQIKVGFSQYTFTNEKGGIISRSQIIRDVTEHEIRESQLRQNEKLATIGHLAAGLAHEIGNPLTSISSLAQLTKRKTSDPAVLENLDKVIVHIKRISKIVREMVDFSRPSKAKAHVTDINEVIRSAVGIFQFDTRAKNIQFHMDLQKDLPDIYADPDQLHQVFLNILINAADANGDSGENVYIQSLTDDEDNIIIRFRDEGPGVPDEIKDAIFEPFFTTKDVGRGTGLGLSVSHGIIRNLNGYISVEDVDPQGALFTVLIPKMGKS